MANVRYGKFEGDAESKAARVYLDGEDVGFVERINRKEFVDAVSRRRRFVLDHFEVSLRADVDGKIDREYETLREAKAAVARFLDALDWRRKMEVKR